MRGKWPITLVKEQSRDAKKWAEAFNQTLIKNGEQPYDPGLLLGWFANAMMAMHDSIHNKEIKTLTAQLKIARDALKTIKSNRMNPDGPAWGAMMIAEEAIQQIEELDEKPGR